VNSRGGQIPGGQARKLLEHAAMVQPRHGGRALLPDMQPFADARFLAAGPIAIEPLVKGPPPATPALIRGIGRLVITTSNGFWEGPARSFQ